MSSTWLLALGETFMAVPDGPRPYKVARLYTPRYAKRSSSSGAVSSSAGGQLSGVGRVAVDARTQACALPLRSTRGAAGV